MDKSPYLTNNTTTRVGSELELLIIIYHVLLFDYRAHIFSLCILLSLFQFLLVRYISLIKYVKGNTIIDVWFKKLRDEI